VCGSFEKNTEYQPGAKLIICGNSGNVLRMLLVFPQILLEHATFCPLSFSYVAA
jgi:hypothetical protein